MSFTFIENSNRHGKVTRSSKENESGNKLESKNLENRILNVSSCSSDDSIPMKSLYFYVDGDICITQYFPKCKCMILCSCQ